MKILFFNRALRILLSTNAMILIAAGIGAIIGGGLVTLFGFQTLFLIMAILCFGSALYIYHLKRIIL